MDVVDMLLKSGADPNLATQVSCMYAIAFLPMEKLINKNKNKIRIRIR